MKWIFLLTLFLANIAHPEIVQRIREITRCSATVVRVSAVTPEPAANPQVIYSAIPVAIVGEKDVPHYVTARNQSENACGLPLLGLPKKSQTRIFGRNDYTAFTMSTKAMTQALKKVEAGEDGQKELPVCLGTKGYRLICYEGRDLTAEQVSMRGKIIVPEGGTTGSDCKQEGNLRLIEESRRDSEPIDKMETQVKAAFDLAGDAIFPDPALKLSDNERAGYLEELNLCRGFMTKSQLRKLDGLTAIPGSVPSEREKGSNSFM